MYTHTLLHRLDAYLSAAAWPPPIVHLLTPDVGLTAQFSPADAQAASRIGPIQQPGFSSEKCLRKNNTGKKAKEENDVSQYLPSVFPFSS